MSGNNFALSPQPPAVFTYLGQKTASGPIFGGVLIGDYVNNSTTTPAGSNYNIPTSTLVAGVPVSAALELQSTTGALLVMRMTTTQRNALVTVVNGMLIYNTSTTTFQFYQNGGWVSLSAGAGGVVGPGGGSTDNAIARWDGAGGTTLQDSVVLVGDTGAITGVLSIANDAGTAAAPSYTFTGRTNTGMYSSAANTLDFAADGTRHLEVGGAVVAVNYLNISGSITLNPLTLTAAGSDTNISIQLVPKGTGQLVNAVGATATPSYTFAGRTDTGMWSSAASTIDFSSTGGRNLQIADSGGTTVNYLTIKGSATNNAVVLGTTGTDGTVNLQLFPKGTTTGQVVFPIGALATPAITFLGRTDTGFFSSAASTIDVVTTGGRQFQFGNVGTAVNYILAKGSATGDPLTLTATGTDSDISINLVPKGLGSAQSVAATSSATPGTIRSIIGATTGTNATMTSGNLVGVRGVVNYVGASGGFLYGTQGKLIPTGTLSGSSWNAGVFGQLDISGATINAGQTAPIWGDYGATSGVLTDRTGMYGIAMTNTTAAVLQGNLYLFGGATNLMLLNDNAGGVGPSYFVAAGTSAGSAGDTTKCNAAQVLTISVNGTSYYIPLFASNA